MSAELLQEWIAKAEQDWEAALQLKESNVEKFADVIAFHCQQTAEKYLKAMLLNEGMEPPPIHILRVLIDLLGPHHPEAERYRDDADVLSRYAVRFRYPEASATDQDATDAIDRARRIRAFVRAKLDLPEEP